MHLVQEQPMISLSSITRHAFVQHNLFFLLDSFKLVNLQLIAEVVRRRTDKDLLQDYQKVKVGNTCRIIYYITYIPPVQTEIKSTLHIEFLQPFFFVAHSKSQIFQYQAVVLVLVP